MGGADAEMRASVQSVSHPVSIQQQLVIQEPSCSVMVPGSANDPHVVTEEGMESPFFRVPTVVCLFFSCWAPWLIKC